MQHVALLKTIFVVLTLLPGFTTEAAAQWGSCNVIEKQSTCIDYSGTYWHGNVQAMKLHCQGQEAFYSRHQGETAPPFGDHRFGTCIHAQFQPYEFMTHFYTLGGGGFDDPAYDFKISQIICQRSGGVWNWGPRRGLQAQ